MKFLSPVVKILTLGVMVLVLLGATKESGVTIHISPGQSVGPESAVSATPAAKIKVSNFQDGRTGNLDPYVIGREARGSDNVLQDMYIQTIYSDRPVFEIVTEAVKSELMRKGYRIVQENEDFSIKGKIVHFWANTSYKLATAWDVAGEVAFTVEVNWPGQKVFSMLGPYNGKKVEHRAMLPTMRKVKQVLEGALVEAIQAMSSDPNLTKTLLQKPKN
jgi:uncharacterized lipoprotein YajG